MATSKANVAKRNIKALAVFAFFRGAGVSTFMTLFPSYMIDLGYNMADIGTVASLSSIPCIALLPFVGILLDSIGRKPIAILTGFTAVFALFIPALTGRYELLILAYALFFFSFIAGQPSRSALLADSIDEELGTAFAKTFMPFHIARAIFPFAAGYLTEIYSYNPVFLSFSLITVIGTIFFAFYSIEPTRKREKIRLKEELKNAFVLEKSILKLYVFAIVDRFAWQLWFPLLNAHFKELGMATSEIGVLNSIASATLFTAATFSGKLIDRIGPIKGLSLSEGIAVLSALLLSLASSRPASVFSVVLIGFSFSLWIPAYNVMIANASSQHQRGKAYSKMNTFRTAVAIPAPQIGGFLYDAFTPSLPFILSIILMMSNISLIWIQKRK